jgi:hypothetical protein
VLTHSKIPVLVYRWAWEKLFQKLPLDFSACGPVG